MDSFTMLSKVLILLFLAAILYNLGAGLYFMMTDKSGSDRVVKALTRRIGLSVLLIVLVIIAIATGLIKPHGIGG
ncbi:twin transmembrane helix small protein [Dokdonella ginsengisoli]|uniref:Twin transmembrane helix small protein n=1 Tax=Dokdonella ginsengisoli TaxID=363846 RepID=A0ABV9QSB2_9GAMM